MYLRTGAETAVACRQRISGLDDSMYAFRPLSQARRSELTFTETILSAGIGHLTRHFAHSFGSDWNLIDILSIRWSTIIKL
jgi:hypothetical protein